MDFLDSNARSELHKLQKALDSNDQLAREKGIKKVVALMRSGEPSVSKLFTSMLRCVGTSDITLKKLIYIYLINFSSQEPEQSIMAVNAFIKDSEDPNPIVRALAVRFMCRIKIDTVAEYMLIPLKKCISDESPFVRKTAALAVAKLYEIIPESVENSELLNLLLNLLKDDNPMVIANATSALFEINSRRTVPFFVLNEATVTPIISATTQSSEWVFVELFDSLANYQPATADEASFLIDRLIPFMKHTNSAVVISAFRCIIIFIRYSKSQPEEIFPLIIPSFLSLIRKSEFPEISFVALRTLTLLVKKYQNYFTKGKLNIRYFFCLYEDPSFVKAEKLEIIVSLTNPTNVVTVLNEFEEYLGNVDIVFVQKTIHCLGKIALKIQASSRRIVDILMNQLSQHETSYVIEAAILVFADLFRIFPGEFESVISQILSHIDLIKDPASRAVVVWMLGQYSPFISNVDVLIDSYLDSFFDESPDVQIQIITSIVKIYLDRGDIVKDQLQFVLEEATKESILPDVRNRALIYWRLLTLDKEAAKEVVVHDCYFIDPNNKQQTPSFPAHLLKDTFNPKVLDILISNVGCVSGIFHILPETVNQKHSVVADHENEFEPNQNSLIELNFNNNELHDWKIAFIQPNDNDVDVFTDWDEQKLFIKVVNKVYSSNEKESYLSNFAIAINSNILGLEIDNESGPIQFPAQLGYGESFEICLKMKYNLQSINPSNMQVALRTSKGTKMFNVPIDLSYLVSAANIDKEQFESHWRQMGVVVKDENGRDVIKNEIITSIQNSQVAEPAILSGRGINTVDFIQNLNEKMWKLSFIVPVNKMYLAKISEANNTVIVHIRGDQSLLPLIQENLSNLFCKLSIDLLQ